MDTKFKIGDWVCDKGDLLHSFGVEVLRIKDDGILICKYPENDEQDSPYTEIEIDPLLVKHWDKYIYNLQS